MKKKFSSRQSPGTTLLEVLLAIALGSIIIASVGTFFFSGINIFSTLSQQNSAIAKFTDTFLLMQKVIQKIRPQDIQANSTDRKIASAAVILFEFVPADQVLLWQGSPILEGILATFSYSDQTPGIGWDPGPTGWTENFATGAIRVELETQGNKNFRLSFIIHPAGN